MVSRQHRRMIDKLRRSGELARRVANPVLFDPAAKDYTCTFCRGRFLKGRDDEQALQEMRAREGEVLAENRCVLCEDCHQLMMEEEAS